MGRPRKRDGEFLVPLVIHELGKGKTLSALAGKDPKNAVLTIAGQRQDANGQLYLEELCRLEGVSLPRRFRQERGFYQEEYERMSSAFRRPGARLKGISMPVPGAFYQPQPLSAGRPKKIRKKPL
jgi:hypothetical protein